VRVLIAPQAFKGSLTAASVAKAAAEGVPHGTQVELLPVADGGEGTVDALITALGGEQRSNAVRGPLNEPVDAHWAMLPGGLAAIEMAAASGLPLLTTDERDPLRASTFGTGQIMAEALNAGASELVIGIGGSATNDGGAGALTALGGRLLDPAGEQVAPAPAQLPRVARVDLSDLHPRLRDVRLRVMCDVTNPLLGPEGATAIYGPQKGVTPSTRPLLEAALEHWADVIERAVAPASGKGRSLRTEPGAGAAG
jgi:glycerate kinase